MNIALSLTISILFKKNYYKFLFYFIRLWKSRYQELVLARSHEQCKAKSVFVSAGHEYMSISSMVSRLDTDLSRREMDMYTENASDYTRMKSANGVLEENQLFLIKGGLSEQIEHVPLGVKSVRLGGGVCIFLKPKQSP